MYCLFLYILLGFILIRNLWLYIRGCNAVYNFYLVLNNGVLIRHVAFLLKKSG